jgi:DNA-binding NtrC family response regulator
MKKAYTIFVVDDNPLVLEGISEELRKELDCRVHSFISAEECIRHLDDDPSMVLTDLNLNPHHELHRISGEQMIEFIRGNFPHIPVIAYSSKKSLDQAVRSMKLGALDFIPKERHFLHKLADSARKNLVSIKNHYREKLAIRLIMFCCFVLATTLLLLNIINPHILMYFMICVVAVWFLWIFIVDEFRFRRTSDLHHHQT